MLCTCVRVCERLCMCVCVTISLSDVFVCVCMSTSHSDMCFVHARVCVSVSACVYV